MKAGNVTKVCHTVESGLLLFLFQCFLFSLCCRRSRRCCFYIVVVVFALKKRSFSASLFVISYVSQLLLFLLRLHVGTCAMCGTSAHIQLQQLCFYFRGLFIATILFCFFTFSSYESIYLDGCGMCGGQLIWLAFPIL